MTPVARLPEPDPRRGGGKQPPPRRPARGSGAANLRTAAHLQRRGRESHVAQPISAETTRGSARQLRAARRCLSASSAGYLRRPSVAHINRDDVRDVGAGTLRRRTRRQGGHAGQRGARVRPRASPRVGCGSADFHPGHARQSEGSVSGLCHRSGSHARGRTRRARVPARHSQVV